MRQAYWLLAATLLLSACSGNSSKKPLSGKWAAATMKVNGVYVENTWLQGSFMEFLAANQYKSQIFGKNELGNYTISNDTLWLNCTSDTAIANKFFNILSADSTQLILQSLSPKNQMTITFIPLKK